ncbi:hypothetical protein [Viscerimonas tarda]
MNIEGIRINNYLRTKADRKIFRVTKIEVIDANNAKINDINALEVEEIPLSDDLLLNRCNFEVKRSISCIALAVLLKDVDKFYIDEKFILIKEKGDYKLFLSSFSTESRHGVEEKKLNYLHQLQNAYYTIAGENLAVSI